MTNTSPWAIEYVDALSTENNKYGGGIWYPISALGPDQIITRGISHRVGNTKFKGMSHWLDGLTPRGFPSDYIMRTPSRTVDIVPTEPNVGGKVYAGTTESDHGTRTQIFKQYLIDANSMIDGRSRGVIARPNIRDILGTTGHATDGKGTKDDDIVFLVSNKNRSVNTKIIIRQSPSGHDDHVPANAAPEIHVILDDSAAAGSRQEFSMTNSDGATPIIKVVNGGTTITLDEAATHKVDILSASTLYTGDFRIDGPLNVTGVIIGGAT